MTSDRPNISLQTYEERHAPALRAFSLPREQERYTDLPATLLDNMAEHREDHFMVILKDEQPVGFFALKHDPTHLSPYRKHEALVLGALSVNAFEQGKGYAGQGMILLKDYVERQWPEIKSIVLGVNVKNRAAQALYEKTGFEDTGRTIMGEMGQQKVFELWCGED